MSKIIFETFRKIWSWEIGNLTRANPSSINWEVNVKKYRVTVEEIEEPKEVIGERLQKLWEINDNYHHHEPLKRAAEAIGYTFTCGFWEKRIRK